MLEPACQADVVIVGAGVAGLSAAHRLNSAGVSTVVLEAAPHVGGRMATEKIDGFRLDRVGRLLSTAYPELRLTPGLDALVLRPFAPGVLVHAEGRVHRAGEPASAGGARGALDAARAFVSPPRRIRQLRQLPPAAVAPVSRAFPPLGSALDQARLAAALGRIATVPVERLLARPDRPAGRALAARGMPARTVEGFLRPLLAALLCDPDLTTSSRCADLALRAFAAGRLCVPEGGAATVPELLADALPPGTVHTGVRVTSLSTTSVTTAEHGELRCRGVLVATGARDAAELLPGLRVPAFHPVTVVHHTADEPPLADAALFLDADRRGPVAHTAVMSQVDPSRAPAGRALISSTVLGAPPADTDLDTDRAVRAHLAALYGTATHRWELLAVHRTPDAVPTMLPPYDLRRPVRLLAGLYVCGDHRDTGTVQGALHSGHRAATALLTDLGVGSPATAAPLPTPTAA
ncbi:NAD(P)/FAD-dependent oxidoreductase [Streptomyces sp. CWNU-52B]|uniref:NAD(P)/FAD-dependent oxidoreductase n=1 Tax=unclassified Streptomyces TaxID=2593676 RepID=UPI0039C293F2